MAKYHPDAFKLYNLCSERHYAPEKFEDRVARFPFDDHNPCKFNEIEVFCRSVHSWLTASPNNLAAIHCKAGKGRTGFMIGTHNSFHQIPICFKIDCVVVTMVSMVSMLFTIQWLV
jgi:protein tyrosine phosphatase